MHGAILYHLRSFAIERFGAGAWDEIQKRADQPGRAHVPVHVYPDQDFDRLLLAMVEEIGLCREDLLEAFGRWMIGPLIHMYRAVIPCSWGAEAFLLNVEEHIHQKVIRLRDPQAQPPRIDVVALSPRVLEVRYRSRRALGALALGAVYGVADHFGERARLLASETKEGGERRFVIRLETAQSPPAEGDCQAGP